MKHPVLKAEKRTVLGKKISNLRKEGILPGNIYGKGLASTAIQVSFPDFKDVYKQVGETGLVDLQLDGKTHPVLVKNLQMNHQDHMLLHVDFFQVNMKEKVKTMVPLVLVGEPKAVTENIGLMLQNINEVEVEALPNDLPENIEVNVEPLAELYAQINVGDLKVPEGVTILTDAGQPVVRIDELVTPEVEEEIAAEEAAAEEAAAEGEEGAPTEAEGEKSEESTQGESETKEE